jgi:hypothetical protein
LTCVVQLVLIFLWHPAVLEAAGQAIQWSQMRNYQQDPSFAAETTHPQPLETLEALYAAGIAIGMVGAVGVLAWIAYRIATRGRRVDFPRFVRCWWRGCLWGTLFVPVVMFAAASTANFVPLSYMGALVPLYLILAPATLVRGEIRVWRRARWRPECPECGYSVFRAAANRCPECGHAYPTPRRFFRRWAIHRLVWDRADRGGLLIPYLRTALAIAICPCRAARRLANPDRFGRAMRWAAAHVVLAALIGTATGSGGYYVGWLLRAGGVAPAVARIPWTSDSPPMTVLLWAAQSFACWLIALSTLPVLGALLGAAVPNRQPAARRGIAKWSLYATCLLVPAICLSNLFATWLGTPTTRTTFVPMGVAVWPFSFVQHPQISTVAMLYAAWWAAGVAANPFLARRGLSVWLVNFWIFLGVWLLLAFVLFAPSGLESLL